MHAPLLRRPFVLLDDARRDGVPARLFRDPVDYVTAHSAEEVEPLFDRLAAWQAEGAWVAGFLAYEAGHALEPRLAGMGVPLEGWPLGWFARFATCERIAPDRVSALLPDPRGALAGRPRPTIAYADYVEAIERVLDHIRAGDIYQANFTYRAEVPVVGHPLALYARLRDAARAGYGGVVWTGSHWLLSFSPELFFSLRDGQVMARPMKGTARRGATPQDDAAAVRTLGSDAKQRAENLMIVDLLRNDLSRIAQSGSVDVPELFRVETYPTIHQLVSDVTAQTRKGTTIADMLRALFPCGSITGAPKLRAMEIIDAVEGGPRGAYTGAIGFVGPDGEAAFNVAIRTLALRDGDSCATLGLGSGVVADSLPDQEWRECAAKGDFITVAAADFDLIETMAFDPFEGVVRLDAHLARLGDSARALGFAFDRHGIRNMLQHATFREREAARVRLRLSRDGAIAVLIEPMPAACGDDPVAVTVAPLPVAPHDVRLRHKTSDRGFYDAARQASGAFETLFTDPEGRLTEGSFTNIFVARDGMLLTPPLALGLLPGVLRAELIAQGRAREAELTPADLNGEWYIGNALRGLIRATIV